MKNARHLFVFAPGLQAASSVDEIEATAEGLKEVGLYAMPYDRDVYIEVSALELFGPLDADPDHNVVYGPFGDGQSVGTAVHDTRRGFITEALPWDCPSEIALLRSMLITLLATRNAEKRTTENKLAKLGIGKSYRHRFCSTTTISLPSSMSDDQDNPPKGGKVSPHLRRGHVRRQHYGIGNLQEKKIWIAPVFVNADPDFVATRRRYVIAAPHSRAA